MLTYTLNHRRVGTLLIYISIWSEDPLKNCGVIEMGAYMDE